MILQSAFAELSTASKKCINIRATPYHYLGRSIKKPLKMLLLKATSACNMFLSGWYFKLYITCNGSLCIVKKLTPHTLFTNTLRPNRQTITDSGIHTTSRRVYDMQNSNIFELCNDTAIVFQKKKHFDNENR